MKVLSYLVLIGVAEVERQPSRSPEIVCAAPKPDAVIFLLRRWGSVLVLWVHLETARYLLDILYLLI